MTGGTPPLEIQTLVAGGTRSLVLTGEIDMSTAPDVEDAIRKLCAEGSSELVLDLRRVTFMDSTGLKAAISARELCQQHGHRLALIPGPKQVQQLFEITDLYNLFEWQEPTSASSRRVTAFYSSLYRVVNR